MTLTKSPREVYQGLAGDPAFQPSTADAAQLATEMRAEYMAVADGQNRLAAADLATTANITLSGEQTIDGTLTSGSRVLVKNQSTASQNGVYVTAAGAWSRASDANSNAEIALAFVHVIGGSANGGKRYQVVNSPTLGTDAVTWAEVGFSADLLALETSLGGAAYSEPADFATSAQGAKADTAVQPADLGDLATKDTITGTDIDDGSVPLVAMADRSAGTVIGRKPGAGDGRPEELSATDLRSLINVANGATANDTDANLKNRANHTGTQAISTVTGLQTALDAKATTAQGALADTAVQPGDAVSDLIETSTAKIMTGTERTKLAGIEAAADVTDTANVTAAGALMDSEVISLSGIKTLTLPDSTTITAAGAALLDDANAAAQRTTLGLGNVDNTSDANKPVSTATQTALDLKANTAALTAETNSRQVGDALIGSMQRPGDLASAYCSEITGAIAATTPYQPSDVQIDTTLGASMQVDAATHVAVRAPVAIEPGRVYQARYALLRQVDPSDPMGDAVEIGVRWLTESAGGVAGGSGNRIAEEIPLTIAMGVQRRAVTFSVDVPGVDFAIPAAARYARPWVRTYGVDHQTRIGRVEMIDITEGWLAQATADATDAGLGTAAAEDVEAFATAAQGGLADSAVQPGDDVSALAETSTAKIMTAAERTKLAAMQAARTDIASASTTDIGAVASDYLRVTGTTTITSLGTAAAGVERTLQFAGALTLTHNGTSLILPGGAGIVTAAGDVAVMRSLGSGNWQCVGYARASGEPVSNATVNAAIDDINDRIGPAEFVEIDSGIMGWLLRWRIGNRLLGGFRPDGTFEVVRHALRDIGIVSLATDAVGRMFASATLAARFEEPGETQPDGIRWRVGDRMLASMDTVRGFYPRKLRIPADAVIDDDLTQTIADRIGNVGGLTSYNAMIGVGWGDSMMSAGAGIAGYLATLFAADGRTFYDQGIGGQRYNQMIARMGLMPLTMTVSGASIPTSGSVVVTGLTTDPLRGPTGYDTTRAMRINVVGVGACTLNWDPAANAGAGGYTITPADHPSPALTVTNPVTWWPTSLYLEGTTDASAALSLEAARDAINVVRIARNDVGKSYDLANVHAYDLSVDGWPRTDIRRLLVLGVTNGLNDLPTAQGGTKATEADSRVVLQEIADINRRRAQWFGSHDYYDVMAFYTGRGEVHDHTVSGTVYPVLDTGLSDGLHEGTTQRQALAAALYPLLQ